MYRQVETDGPIRIADGWNIPLATLADEFGGRAQIVNDDHCFVLLMQDADGNYRPATHIFREAFEVMRTLSSPE